jgi:limonene-1,2-epoxide hydrolase
MSTTTDTTRNAAATYFTAWQDRDFDRLRTVLAPDVTFVGALGTASGIDECIAGLRGMAESVMARIDVQARVADGADVITWFDLVTQQGPVLPTANWSHVEDGLITAIRVAFDPRPLTDA